MQRRQPWLKEKMIQQTRQQKQDTGYDENFCLIHPKTFPLGAAAEAIYAIGFSPLRQQIAIEKGDIQQGQKDNEQRRKGRVKIFGYRAHVGLGRKRYMRAGERFG